MCFTECVENDMVRSPGLFGTLFEGSHSCQHFRSRCPLPVQLQHELHHELLAQDLKLLFRSLLVDKFKACLLSSRK